MENNLELLHAKKMLSDYKKYGITENELAKLLQINLFTLRKIKELSLIHISEPTRRTERSRMPSSA